MDTQGGYPAHTMPSTPIAYDKAYQSFTDRSLQTQRLRQQGDGKDIDPGPCIAAEADFLQPC
jgi:hypothetical protein